MCTFSQWNEHDRCTGSWGEFVMIFDFSLIDTFTYVYIRSFLSHECILDPKRILKISHSKYQCRLNCSPRVMSERISELHGASVSARFIAGPYQGYWKIVAKPMMLYSSQPITRMGLRARKRCHGPSRHLPYHIGGSDITCMMENGVQMLYTCRCKL